MDSRRPNKWKSQLASSGVPLEYEVARLLVEQGFAVTADYTYSRRDCGTSKDFSVDLEASHFTPFDEPNAVTAQLSLLVECKFRVDGTAWLFFPDPNEPDLSPITLGHTVRSVHEFSPVRLPANATVPFDEDLAFCFKGVEIKMPKGDVFERDIRRGIGQLQYALPRLLHDNTHFDGGDHPDAIPFFLCPILVTTAELRLCKPELATADVRGAEGLDDISSRVPVLVAYQDYAPDFEAHCIDAFAGFETLPATPRFATLAERYASAEDELGSFAGPSYLAKGLASGTRSVLHSHFCQFVVCERPALGGVLKHLKEVCASAIAAATPV